MDSCHEGCSIHISSMHQIFGGTKITIHANLEPFSYCNAVEASYANHCSGIEVGTTMSNSSGTCHDPNTILASTLSTVKINYQGCLEYNLIDAFSIGALPLDPHTQGCLTHQGPILQTTSLIILFLYG